MDKNMNVSGQRTSRIWRRGIPALFCLVLVAGSGSFFLQISLWSSGDQDLLSHGDILALSYMRSSSDLSRSAIAFSDYSEMLLRDYSGMKTISSTLLVNPSEIFSKDLSMEALLTILSAANAGFIFLRPTDFHSVSSLADNGRLSLLVSCLSRVVASEGTLLLVIPPLAPPSTRSEFIFVKSNSWVEQSKQVSKDDVMMLALSEAGISFSTAEKGALVLRRALLTFDNTEWSDTERSTMEAWVECGGTLIIVECTDCSGKESNEEAKFSVAVTRRGTGQVITISHGFLVEPQNVNSTILTQLVSLFHSFDLGSFEPPEHPSQSYLLFSSDYIANNTDVPCSGIAFPPGMTLVESVRVKSLNDVLTLTETSATLIEMITIGKPHFSVTSRLLNASAGAGLYLRLDSCTYPSIRINLTGSSKLLLTFSVRSQRTTLSLSNCSITLEGVHLNESTRDWGVTWSTRDPVSFTLTPVFYDPGCEGFTFISPPEVMIGESVVSEVNDGKRRVCYNLTLLSGIVSSGMELRCSVVTNASVQFAISYADGTFEYTILQASNTTKSFRIPFKGGEVVESLLIYVIAPTSSTGRYMASFSYLEIGSVAYTPTIANTILAQGATITIKDLSVLRPTGCAEEELMVLTADGGIVILKPVEIDG